LSSSKVLQIFTLNFVYFVYCNLSRKVVI
jgi:hypothetical protein